jgi:stage V sporulation protein AD
MAKKQGKRTIIFENKPRIISYASAVGKKEHEGPLSDEFDYFSEDSLFGEKSFEKAESRLQKTAITIALQKEKLKASDIDKIFAGDLLNQCIGSSFGIRELGIPFIGLYGACSTMALSTALASIFIDSGAADKAIAVTSSHFCSAERQYRFPLDYGSQRTPTAQWTVTGSGALILGKKGNGPYINSVCFGEIEDFGITDANNMGPAMAPDDVKIRPYPTNEGMVFFYTQIQYLRGLRALFKGFLMRKTVEKSVNEIYAQSRNYYKKEEEF